MLLGLTGAGKSRLGNKLSGNNLFKESDGSDSCTKNIDKAFNQFNVEIIDTPGLADTDNEEKENLIVIANEIKKSKPNILAYVQNASDKRFKGNSQKAIEKICEMFKTKSIWNHFAIIFTFAAIVSPAKRENRAKSFSEWILKVLRRYYGKNDPKDNLPIPTRLNYFFVELDDDESKLDKDTIDSLGDIMKLFIVMHPISDIRDKIIVEIKEKRNCQKSIKKYDRIVDNPNGSFLENAAYGGSAAGSLAAGGGAFMASGTALAALGVATGAPCVIPALVIWGITSYLTKDKLDEKVKNADLKHKVDENYKNEDYITYDEITYVYHDGTEETKMINIKNFTRIISK